MELRCFDYTSLRWIKDREITILYLKDHYRPALYEWIKWSNFDCKLVIPKNMVLWE